MAHPTPSPQSSTSNIPSPLSSPPSVKSGKATGSWIWEGHFEKVVDETGKRFAHCQWCKKEQRKNAKGEPLGVYVLSNNQGTGTFTRHLQSVHGIRVKPLKGGQSQISGFATANPGAGLFCFSKTSMVDKFSSLIVADELPFQFCESLNLEFCLKASLNPQYSRIPRNTVKRRIIGQFKTDMAAMKNCFKSFSNRVALTSDTWTSPHTYEPYLCITVHWVDEHWLLQKRIIAFDIMEESHSGFNIKQRIVDTLNDFHLGDKVFSIAFDNATANTNCISHLKEELSLLCDGEFLHIRCCAHVLNLCVQEGLLSLCDFISPIRLVVKWLRQSRDKKREYKELCKKSNLRPKMFCLDSPTRWNSTYKLLSQCFKYRSVLSNLYNKYSKDNTRMITNADWDLAAKLFEVLGVFDKATKAFSLVYKPNVHLVIPTCVGIIRVLYKYKDVSELKPVISGMLSKWMTYFEKFPLIYAIACILDPRVKVQGLISWLEFYYKALGLDFNVQTYVESATTRLHDLYSVYAKTDESQSQVPQNHSDNVSASSCPFVDDDLYSMVKKQRTINMVDEYLCSMFDINDKFDILVWWKSRKNQFSTLANIAKDIFAIPASTIASEAAFSAGKRVLDEKRCSLTPDSIKICVCKKDWDQAERRTQGLIVDDESDEDDPLTLLDQDSSSSETEENSQNA